MLGCPQPKKSESPKPKTEKYFSSKTSKMLINIFETYFQYLAGRGVILTGLSPTQRRLTLILGLRDAI